jgi:hypothetical protein
MVAYPQDFSFEISKKGFTKLNSVYYPLRNSQFIFACELEVRT